MGRFQPVEYHGCYGASNTYTRTVHCSPQAVWDGFERRSLAYAYRKDDAVYPFCIMEWRRMTHICECFQEFRMRSIAIDQCLFVYLKWFFLSYALVVVTRYNLRMQCYSFRLFLNVAFFIAFTCVNCNWFTSHLWMVYWIMSENQQLLYVILFPLTFNCCLLPTYGNYLLTIGSVLLLALYSNYCLIGCRFFLYLIRTKSIFLFTTVSIWIENSLKFVIISEFYNFQFQ